MICVIQFDAAGEAVLERLIGEGRMPVLAELFGRHERRRLAGPAAHFPAAVFPCLYTGTPLGEHGHFYPFQWQPREQRARPAHALPYPPVVWERIAQAGGRALVVDPYEAPRRAAPGLDIVSGVGFRDRVVLPGWAAPRRAGRTARRAAGGPAPQVSEVFGRPRLAELRRLRDALLAAPGRTAAAARAALAESACDLAWVGFCAAHVGAHQFWDLSQLDDIDAESRRELETALEQICVASDRAIGTLIEALPAGSEIVLVSALGMGVNTSRADLLPQMLAGVLSGAPLEHGRGAGAWGLRGLVPSGLRGAVARALPERLALELTARLEVSGYDWSTTRVFAMPADNQGYVRLNLRGRERDGIVEPGQAGALLEEIGEGLRSFTDPDGAPAIARIDSVAGSYPGPAAGILPDLVVSWAERPSTRLELVRSPRFGEARRLGAGTGRAGNHPANDAWYLTSAGFEPPRELTGLAGRISACAGLGER